MTIADLTQLSAWPQSQRGNIATIADLLTTTLGDPALRVEVSRRDRTLYVLLTAPNLDGLPQHINRIHTVVTALALPDIIELKVVDGTDRPLEYRWQQVFSLNAAAPTPPATIFADGPSAEGGAVGIAPTARSSTESVPAPAASSPHRWRWGALSMATVLGFGLAAGITQWRYEQQRVSSPTQSLPATKAGMTQAIEPLLPAASTAALALPDIAAPVALTIKAVGDIIPGTDYQRYRLPDDWQYLFGSIQYHLGEADITFGNFESTLTEVPSSAKDTSSANTFAFRTPPWYASVLKEAGFDVLSVANNHSMDFFEQGFTDTIAHIEAAGMKAVGRKGEILYVEAQGQTVAFIGFSNYQEHNRVQDIEAAIALVETANAQADIIVVSFHAGKEGTDATVTRDQDELFYSENRGNVVRFSRAVVDHGADLVLGHGPHVPRAIELYNNKLIAYSLGNFLGYRSLSTVGPLGTSLILQTDLDAQGNFVSGRIIPVALDRNGVPYLDDHFGGVVLVRQFTQRDFPDTPLEIDDLGYIWPQ
ncbi:MULTISPECIES: CapA family protein [Cyanophyceae]|uniref:CapA family protein n=1 Tax=Cyanophyceae TaxID=3028117 RepID=UPI0018EFD0E8|nr:MULTISPECIES: CapA family protein [unclassified Phormidium]